MKRLIFIFVVLVNLVYGEEYKVTDAYNKIYRLNKSYTRIISLYPAHTEVLMNIGARDKLVGTTVDRNAKAEEGIVEFKLGDSVEKFISLRQTWYW